jgi:hypothetical protein
VLSGQACGPTPEFFGQLGVFAVLAAPLVELATRRGQGNRNVRWLSAAHQSFSQKVSLAGQPDDPLHGPPIKRNLPATTDDTSNNESFHAALPKGHKRSNPVVPAPLQLVRPALAVSFRQA